MNNVVYLSVSLSFEYNVYCINSTINYKTNTFDMPLLIKPIIKIIWLYGFYSSIVISHSIFSSWNISTGWLVDIYAPEVFFHI